MEIKIDTKKDSAEDIKKAIDLLKRIVEASTGESYGSEINPTGEVSSGMAGLFGGEPVLGAPSDSNDDESKDEEDEKQNIQIIPY